MRHDESGGLPFFVRFLEARGRRGDPSEVGSPAQDAADGDHAAMKCSSESAQRDAG